MTAVPVSASRVAKAEVAFKQAAKATEYEKAATAARYQDENKRSEVRAQANRMSIMSGWPSLRSAIGWFKREWQGALPWAMHEGYDTVEPDDVLGGPALTDRWRSYLYAQEGTGDSPEPIRQAMRQMAVSSNGYERSASAFLFAMACMDFNPEAAGLAIKGHCRCEPERDESGRYLTPHAAWTTCYRRIDPLFPEFAPYYAEQAIERLRQRVVAILQRMPRSIPAPAWKSESQSIAEASA